MGTPGNKRLLTELRKLIEWESEKKFILDSWPFTSGFPTYEMSHLIRGRIFPDKDPYRFASFLIEIDLSLEFPFKPPMVRIVDRIYHPYIKENGGLCCKWEFDFDAWRPTTSIVDSIKHVLKVINLDCDHSHHSEVAIEYHNDYEKFYEKALQCTLTYGRPR